MHTGGAGGGGETPHVYEVHKVSSKQFKTPSEVVAAVLETGVNKSKHSLDQLIILGFLAGVYISLGGIFSQVVSIGATGLAQSNPSLQRLLVGVTFPVALMLIIITGGELFTGNVMFFLVALVDRKITWKDLARNWVTLDFSNYAGCVAGAYFYGYLTDVFATEPYLSGIRHVAVVKTEADFGVVFFKAIAANQLVNLAILSCIASQDVISKIASSWFIIGTFATIGFEHVIANMYNTSISLMYSAPVGYGEVLYKCLIPTTLGRGGVMVGLMNYYVYLYKGHRETGSVKKDEVDTFHAIHDARAHHRHPHVLPQAAPPNL